LCVDCKWRVCLKRAEVSKFLWQAVKLDARHALVKLNGKTVQTALIPDHRPTADVVQCKIEQRTLRRRLGNETRGSWLFAQALHVHGC
jgi:hypothetical protein